MKIYDGFIFFNELDLLDIRLNTMCDVVDHFILVESSVTHQGTPKSYIFEENKQRFSKYLDKIIHIKVDNTPNNFSSLEEIEGTTFRDGVYNSIVRNIKSTTLFNINDINQRGFGRDFFQKESVKLGMEFASKEDILISSDLDEVPNPEIISRLSEFYESDCLYTFSQLHYCYYLNMIYHTHINNSRINSEVTNNWHGSRMGCWSMLQSYSLNQLRAQENNIIMDGGWHFSWQGGKDRVKLKLQSYSHQENNQQSIISGIDSILDGRDSFIDFRGGRADRVNITLETHPEYLVSNLDKFKHLIKD
jgi:beta-1,4-mannosyl-glycoprotein beta-1,4-N-acetylglucosaminyltransferase